MTSDYLGSGSSAEFEALLDAYERYFKARLRQIRRERKDKVRYFDKDVDGLGDIIQAINRACLLVSGYHLHKGQWRKKSYG